MKMQFAGILPTSHFCEKVVMERKFLNILLPEHDTDAVAVLLYGAIGKDEKVDCSSVVAEIMQLSDKYKNIDIRINSLGGEVFAGMAIFNALRTSPANINIYVDGVAASMAAVIALCGRPLHMSRYSRLMLHQVSGGVMGTSAEIRSYADQIDSLNEVLVSVVSERSGLTSDEVKTRWFDGKDHWITAQEAIQLHLADSIFDMQEGKTPEEGASAEMIYEFTNRLYMQPQINDNMVLIEELKKRPSFKNATSEEQVLAEVGRLENEAAKVPALEKELNTMRAEKAAAERAAHEVLVNQAISDGRIQAAQKEQFLNLMGKDFAGVKAILEGMPKSNRKINDFINETGSSKATARQQLEAMSWDEIDKAERLMELKNEHPDLYEAKMKAKFNA